MSELRKTAVATLALVGAAVAVGAYAWIPDRPLPELKARYGGPPSQFVEVLGISGHVRDEGPRDDPNPIVLIHGIGGSLHSWDSWVEALKPTRRVIRFDLDGFGLTGPRPDGEYTIDNDVAFTTALLDRLGVRRCVLVGHSLGGAIAWNLALLEPSRVERLILVNSGGYETGSTPLVLRLVGLPVLGPAMLHLLPRSQYRANIEALYGDSARVSEKTVDSYFDLSRRAGNREALSQRFGNSDAFVDRAPKLKTLAVPTLLLWGQRDTVTPVEDARRFHAAIPDSHLVVLPGVGHAPMEEDPVRSLAAVEAFLALPVKKVAPGA